MSYLVLARKYRPHVFADVAGQEHVTRTLINAIKRDKVAHAYLFAGPRGVGKTSIARIFSKALNCEKGPTSEPCGVCGNCKEITSGNALAVREIDGASHNSVDNVRELIDSFRSLPAPGYRFKIYIIDEVHMLSTAAFNALLKSLEEPPPNTVLILATTELHKIPDTVISRCQRFEFRALHTEAIESRLRAIAESEGYEVEPELYRMISRLADGSMRDAQSLLDRVDAFCDGKLTVAEASKVLGSVERVLLFEISAAIFEHDADRALKGIAKAFRAGTDPGLFCQDFALHWRELMLGSMGGEKALQRLGVPSSEQEEILKQVKGRGQNNVHDLSEVARRGADAALRSSYPVFALEALAARMALREEAQDIAQLIEQLKTSNADAPRLSPQKKKTLSA